ncbi:hypothetical protein TVAG_482790 [Trichomonas vaginalis G3]|uniref:Uncharacterized protein n=1 Tax=Trichomonas vaginalis (strain ATCC PRA-98 / G3) TaxID=412133 RepID=A2FRR4_TRIV3|nr:hypothetical protein TVAGG3_0208610 [Trichomonas vaginalis G3]EAX92403.1 hypothetical protein TVAG_482790 [Trichomonas vaginalis G3]KAI5551083.1 hypothetical protein TVAGG3_0208610 [Trichomonas vaginalis G3]|eukprot:XP_001305333.1 hypothetical protein [Trichomonas vaginalis G3]
MNRAVNQKPQSKDAKLQSNKSTEKKKIAITVDEEEYEKFKKWQKMKNSNDSDYSDSSYSYSSDEENTYTHHLYPRPTLLFPLGPLRRPPFPFHLHPEFGPGVPPHPWIRGPPPPHGFHHHRFPLPPPRFWPYIIEKECLYENLKGNDFNQTYSKTHHHHRHELNHPQYPQGTIPDLSSKKPSGNSSQPIYPPPPNYNQDITGQSQGYFVPPPPNNGGMYISESKDSPDPVHWALFTSNNPYYNTACPPNPDDMDMKETMNKIHAAINTVAARNNSK